MTDGVTTSQSQLCSSEELARLEQSLNTTEYRQTIGHILIIRQHSTE